MTSGDAAAGPDAERGTLTPGLTALLAVAAGAAVANLYWSQPLLDLIAEDLGAPVSYAGWLVTATQIAYAVGICLLVPLGDVMNRRRLIPATMGCAALALVACALAPGLAVLLGTLAALGLTTVAGQILAPLAGDLADPAHAGRAVGTVISGILTGILVSRTVAGLVAGLFGWRAIYVLAAVLTGAMALVLYRRLPDLPAKTRMPYAALVASTGRVVARERVVRWTLVLGASGFGLFTMFWTALTFLLSSPPYAYSVTTIGLFGLAGLAGAITAQRAGILHDRGLSLAGTGAGWLLALIVFGLALAAERSVVIVLAVVVLLDIAIQAMNILNQSRVLAVSHEERSRLNTAFVTANFLGGAAGSAAASVLWSVGGWTAVCVAGMVVSGLALGVWAVGRRGPLVPAPRRTR